MSRVWIGAAVGLAVIVGVMVNVQPVAAMDSAIVIKNDGLCGMPGSDADGNLIVGGLGQVETIIENGNKVMIKCKGTDVTNLSGQGQTFRGFLCGLQDHNGDPFVVTDSHATVSASGVGTLTCTYRK